MKQRGRLWAAGVIFGVCGAAAGSGGCGPDEQIFTGGAGGTTSGTAGTTTGMGGTTTGMGATHTGGSVGGGGTGGPGGGGSTTNMPCNPGDEVSCYDGPDGTQDVGECKAGVAKCKQDGSGYGPCNGQVQPSAENCAKPEDEDCDGKAPACTGAHVWAKRFGGSKDEPGPFAVAVDPSDNVVLAGGLQDMVDFGGGPLTGMSVDAVVVELDADGNHLWSRSFGAASFDIGYRAVADAAGNVLLTGSFQDAVNFGGGLLTSNGTADAFLVKLDKSGDHVWSQHFGDAQQQQGTALAVDGAGNIYLCGTFQGTIDLGGGALSSAGTYDIFVAKLAANGSHLWSKAFKNTDTVTCRGVALDPAGDVVIAGTFSSDLDLGESMLALAPGSNNPDIFVVKLDSAGGLVWGESYGNLAVQTVRGVAVDASGDVFLTGQFYGVVNFGGSALINAGGADGFVAKLSSDGAHVWSKSFGDVSDQAGNGIAVDAAGNVVIAGVFSGAVDFGGGALISAGFDDAFLVKLDTDGQHLWSQRFGDAATQTGESVAVDSTGALLFAGEFGGTTDFGGGGLTCVGSEDIFLAKRVP